MAGGVDAFALLVEELKSDDVIDQVNAAKRVNTIALAMGPDRARSQLLPFLRQCVDDYTDEILLAIAESAGTLVPALGGNEYAHTLIPLLESLAEKEETIVRQKAVESLVVIGKSMPAQNIQNEFKELMKRLSAGDFFPSRISSSGLFATLYPSTPAAMRPALRKQYEALAKDEMPMVRSAAFQHMPKFVAVLEKDVIITEIAPLFNELSNDMQESVREIAMENMVEIVKFLSAEEASRLFGQFFDNVQNEKCSLMRVNKAKHFVQLVSAMHPTRPIRDQVPAFIHLLASDPEFEVRNAAASNIGTFCEKLDSATVLNQILPVLKDLSQPDDQPVVQGSTSPTQQVREHIAENACSISSVIGRDPTISTLLPLLKLFLGDEQIEIKRKVLRTVAPLVETLGSDACDQHFIPEVLKMAQDVQWRVRLAVVETLPVYAKHLGMELFNSRFKDIQTRALSDSFAHIRERAIKNLGLLHFLLKGTRLTLRVEELCSCFGDSWINEEILPSIEEASKGTGPASYLGRITSLQAVSQLAGVVPSSALTDRLVQQIAIPLARDKVTNVRIAAADALKKCAEKLTGENPAFVRDTIRPVLVDLSQDSDVDVKYLAQSALA